jgi:hypothetical protein
VVWAKIGRIAREGECAAGLHSTYPSACNHSVFSEMGSDREQNESGLRHPNAFKSRKAALLSVVSAWCH